MDSVLFSIHTAEMYYASQQNNEHMLMDSIFVNSAL